MLLSDAMNLGLAEWLTKWVKEIDYWYLLLGSLGIAVSVSRLEIFGGQKIEILDEFGPLVLTAVVALRLVKTQNRD
jgi:hypothetical protein